MPVQTTAKKVSDSTPYVPWRERIEGLEDLLVTPPKHLPDVLDGTEPCSNPPATWKGTPAAWADLWHPADRDRSPEPIRACLGCPFQIECLHDAVHHVDDGIRAGVTRAGLREIRVELKIPLDSRSVTPMLNAIANELKRKRSEQAKAQHAANKLRDRERDSEGRLVPSPDPTPQVLAEREKSRRRRAKARARKVAGYLVPEQRRDRTRPVVDVHLPDQQGESGEVAA